MSNKPARMLEDEVVEGITERLSLLPDLHLPFSLRSRGDSLSNSEKKSHLEDLLRRDAAIFLERHGRRLNPTELQEFDALKEDYEINWHLKQLKMSINPTAEQKKAHAAVVKNRRLAFMDKLIQEGDFFSEDAMRMRAPLLYHQHLGRFQDPSERAFARPGERWSEMSIRQGEEVEYQARLKSEKEKAGLAESDDEEQEEEEEEDKDEEEEEEEDSEEEEELKCKNREQNVQSYESLGIPILVSNKPSWNRMYQVEKLQCLKLKEELPICKHLNNDSSQNWKNFLVICTISLCLVEVQRILDHLSQV